MNVDFFETELARIQDGFNQTFGKMVVCNIRTRQKTILAIVDMGLLERKISKAKTKDAVRDDIRRFMRTHQILTKLFDGIERRNYVSNEQNQRRSGEDCATG